MSTSLPVVNLTSLDVVVVQTFVVGESPSWDNTRQTCLRKFLGPRSEAEFDATHFDWDLFLYWLKVEFEFNQDNHTLVSSPSGEGEEITTQAAWWNLLSEIESGSTSIRNGGELGFVLMPKESGAGPSAGVSGVSYDATPLLDHSPQMITDAAVSQGPQRKAQIVDPRTRAQSSVHTRDDGRSEVLDTGFAHKLHSALMNRISGEVQLALEILELCNTTEKCKIAKGVLSQFQVDNKVNVYEHMEIRVEIESVTPSRGPQDRPEDSPLVPQPLRIGRARSLTAEKGVLDVSAPSVEDSFAQLLVAPRDLPPQTPPKRASPASRIPTRSGRRESPKTRDSPAVSPTPGKKVSSGSGSPKRRVDPTSPAMPVVPTRLQRLITRQGTSGLFGRNTTGILGRNPMVGRGGNKLDRVAQDRKNASAMAEKSSTTLVDASAMLKLGFEESEEVDEDYENCDTFVDATLGAFQANDDLTTWKDCLEFFMFDVNDYLARTEGLDGKKAIAPPAKRVGIKKLYGMNLSLFDYQLMGVYTLLVQLTRDCHGGFLADACGLGKTIEMFAVIAVATTLRRLFVEYVAESRAGKSKNHITQVTRRKSRCPSETRYGLSCPCRSQVALEIARRLPDGLNLLLTPAKTSEQLLQQAKRLLDPKVFRVRAEGVNAKAADRLTSKEVKVIAAGTTVRSIDSGTGNFDMRNVEYSFASSRGQENVVLIVPHAELETISTRLFGCDVPVKVATQGSMTVDARVAGLMPGLVFLDEFHEYAQKSTPAVDWVMARLQHPKESQRPPCVFFVSGTPIEFSPADLRAPLSMLEWLEWTQPEDPHPMGLATTRRLDDLSRKFATLIRRQQDGELLTRAEVRRYHVILSSILGKVMVRRLATDTFRGRPITELGPMAVKVHHVPIPKAHAGNIDNLAQTIRIRLHAEAKSTETSLAALLTSDLGAKVSYMPALRLAGTFPAVTEATGVELCRLSDAEICGELRKWDGKVQSLWLWNRVPSWTRDSPKLTVILKVAKEMVEDDSRIEGESTRAKKLCIFTTTEAEAILIFSYLIQAKDASTKSDSVARHLRPVYVPPAGVGKDQEGFEAVHLFRQMGHQTPNVLVASMARAGTGLDFPQAKYAVVTGLGWRKSDSQQAFARTHRVGQKQRTQLHLLVSRGNPVERRLFDRQNGIAVPVETDDAWLVAAEGDAIPGPGTVGADRLVQGNVALG
jgi:hypothetical protein